MLRWWCRAFLFIGLLVGTVCFQGLALPTVDFTIDPQTPIVTQIITFTATASGFEPGWITGYEWDFGDGATASGESVQHAFMMEGEYRVTLTVSDSRGGETMLAKTVSVVHPVAGFSWIPAAPTTQDDVHFTDRSTPAEGIASWSWDFGDGGGSAAQNPTYIFAEMRTYRVTLTITYETGVSAFTSHDIDVANAPPIADFTFTPQTPRVGEPVTFTADGSSDPDGRIVSYAWDFDNDGEYDIQGGAAARTVVYSFDQGDIRCLVTLKVTDDRGDASTISREVPVAWSPPTAEFSFAPTNPKVGEAVTFDGSDSMDGDNGAIVSYEWDFDDDGIIGDIDATGVTVNHSFATAGVHRVALTVTDNTGQQDSTPQFVEVSISSPTARFTFTPPNPNTGQVVSFDASSSTDADGTIILYQWNFGDGSPAATGLAVTHSYPAPGVYPVQLRVTDNDLEFDVTTQGVPVEMGGTGGVNQLPVADFTYEPASPPDVNLNEVVTFKADGCSDPDGTIAAYEWDFNGDGLYDATGTTVTHIFHRGGGHVVTLRVFDNDGAPGFATHVVSVEFIRPIADFSFAPPGPKIGDVVSFDGSASSDADGRVDFYEWDFNSDGVVDATGMSVNHVFNTGG
ncbi:PKD domain-containing protein, partial [Candidatus Bipolaricaulota bacterium]|nr:PKD domain-containing protein [Candidatus Bipolaricaulota bacterium]